MLGLWGYRANLISTIVDKAVERDNDVGYRAILISTIVDHQCRHCRSAGYRANLISTIVDIKGRFFDFLWLRNPNDRF